jgi:hypothetical protein
MRKKILSVVVALVFVLGISGLALANNGALGDFNAQYPANTLGSSCSICHTNAPNTNPYGAALVGQGATGDAIAAAMFQAVETVDSDGDGATNIQEINQGFFPGDPTSTPPPVGVTITITAPVGGAIIASGSTTNITYDAPAEVTSVKVKYSLDNGVTWGIAQEGVGSVLGSFVWTVPTPTKNKTKTLVKVIGFNASNAKVGSGKSAAFTIETVTITAPTSLDTLTGGGSFTINWLTNGTKAPVDRIKLLYSTNNGTTWKLITKTAAGTGNPGTFTWTPVASVPKLKPNSLIKVILMDAAGNTVGSDVSDKFSIQ